jgi:hypothetical protein
MRDRPAMAELLEAFADFYRTHLLPVLPRELAYQARVAANVLDIVRRELRLGVQADEWELASLQKLLQQPGDLESLNRLLCERIAGGDLELRDPGLADHLWRVTLNKLAIDQPSYSAYQAETGESAPGGSENR